MAIKIKLSKSGYNVLTETDPNNLTFSSDYDTFKYYTSGSISLDVDSGDDFARTDITHGLGYIPVFIAYIELDFSVGSGNWTQVPVNYVDFFGTATITAYADSNKLYFETSAEGTTFGDITLNFTYKIFRNDTLL